MADQNLKPELFELNNGTMRALITNLGCTITSLSVPDKDGKLADVVLGFDSLEPYLKGAAPYFGSIVGRVANRIKDGKFKLLRLCAISDSLEIVSDSLTAQKSEPEHTLSLISQFSN